MKEFSPDIFTKCQDDLKNQGFTILDLDLNQDILTLTKTKQYDLLDKALAEYVKPERALYELLSNFESFTEIEFILSLREAKNDWEEDGIWHDDGSRKLAFSLSLTLDPPLGGKLGFREKGSRETQFIETPPFGTIIIFKTGVSGYEHKIHKVEAGARLIMAGWCS